MDTEREMQRLSDEVRLLCEAVSALAGVRRTQPASQLTLAGVIADVAERTAVQMGEPAELDRVEEQLSRLLPAGEGIGVLVGGIMHEQATTRWHKIAAWQNFAELPDGAMVKFLEPLGNPHRVELVRQLAMGLCTTGELQRATDMSGGQFYHHLSKLAEAGYVARMSQGHFALSTRGKVALACLAALCSLLAEWPEDIGERRAREKLVGHDSEAAGTEVPTDEPDDEPEPSERGEDSDTAAVGDEHHQAESPPT